MVKEMEKVGNWENLEKLEVKDEMSEKEVKEEEEKTSTWSSSMALCQLRNAWLELGHKAIGPLRRKYLYAEVPSVLPSDPKKPVVEATTRLYWQERVRNKAFSKNSATTSEALLDFLGTLQDPTCQGFHEYFCIF